jgi:DNA-directed RNA polymerase
VLEPAFTHCIDQNKKEAFKVQGFVRFHPKLMAEMMERDAKPSVGPRLLPMLVPPKPWMTYDSGGYLTQTSAQPLVRIVGNHELRDLLKEADTQGDLETVFHGLDILGATPWRVNKLLLDVTMTCWNLQGTWPCIASNVSTPEIPKQNTQRIFSCFR